MILLSGFGIKAFNFEVNLIFSGNVGSDKSTEKPKASKTSA